MSSIRDVAKLCHVSPATVSRVLNNDQTYKTTPETRKNVLRAVAELDYKPLARKRKKDAPQGQGRPMISIGCLLATTKGKYSDPYYLSILSGIESEMERLGGAVTFLHTEQELENKEVLANLLSMRLDGLVLMRPIADPLFALLRSNIPHLVGIDIGHASIDSIDYDHARVSRMAVEYLYKKGHRQIGFVGGAVGKVPLIQCRRYRSYVETMADFGLPIHHEWVLDCKWDDKLCIRLVEKVHKSHVLPTAFYAASDLMGIAVLRALCQLGVSVPDEVAVMGMSNIEMSQYTNPPLTTIDVPTYEMGVTVARTITNRIQGDATLPKRIILPSTLIERGSV
ncbi:MAG: LacI family transcriptional regulator [Oscillospiraceae bacterium]|jgi:DNA-binding LacI/PurR family transcriptional regulator|nr:LacI family transcriptional regulator [Oscillospiraceae bacterium]